MTAFQRFLAASGLANLADGIAVLAWVWVATYLTRDAGLIALVPVALRLPWAVFAIPAGIVADRVDRRLLVIVMDVVRALAFLVAGVAMARAGTLPPAPVTDVTSVPLFAALCLCALAVGVAEVFRDNAAQTLLPAIVPDAGLERANGRMWVVEAVGNQLVGPALGAFLLGVTLALPFAFNATCYGLAAVLMLRVAGGGRPPPPQDRRWRKALAEAWQYLRGQPLLLLLAVITGVWNLCFEAVMFTLVLHVQENLGLNAQGYGFVLAAMAAGGITAGLIGDRIANRLGRARTMQLALALSSVLLLAVPLAPNGWVLAGCFVMFELSGITWNIVSVSLRQRLIPDRLRGRVNSLYRLLAWGMIPVGIAAAGWIIGAAEPQIGRSAAVALPLWLAGGVLVVLTVLVLRPLARGMQAAKLRE